MTLAPQRIHKRGGEFDDGAISAFVEGVAAADLGVHGLIVMQHGAIVAEKSWGPYELTEPHLMYSISKSFTSTAVGLAIDEGALELDEPITEILRPHSKAAAKNMDGVRVRDLLAMASGHVVDTSITMRNLPGEDWIKIFFDVPTVYPPGTHFLYNSGNTYLLSAAIRARTGFGLKDYLQPRLFDPLGIESPRWDLSPAGVEIGWSGLWLSAEDLAAFGQLYLQRGAWGGAQLLGEAWVDSATSLQVRNDGDPADADSDWSQGYGFQFWRSNHNSYRADGAYGQFCFVLPEQDAVIAVTSGTEANREIPPMVFKHLLPALSGSHKATPGETPAAQVLPPSFWQRDVDVERSLSNRRIKLAFNQHDLTSVTIGFGSEIEVSFTSGSGETEEFTAGRSRWIHGAATVLPAYEIGRVRTANSAGWTDESTFEIHQLLLGTPFRRVLKFVFGRARGVVDVVIELIPTPWSYQTERLEGRIGSVARSGVAE